MNKTKKSFATLIILFLLPSCFGPCQLAKPERIEANVKSKNLNVAANDFDLSAVVSTIKSNKVKDMSALEKLINERNGLNNVDTDKDGKVDYINIKESRVGDKVTFNFYAIPSKTGEEKNEVKIADVTFVYEKGNKSMVVDGQYDSGVEGGEKGYKTVVHQSGPSWGQMFFFAWLMTPSRPLFYQPYHMGMYHPHSVVPNSYLSKQRMQYQQKNNLSRVGTYKKAPVGSSVKKPGFFSRFKKSGLGGKRRGFGRGFRRR